MTLSQLNQAAVHFSKAFELYGEARRDDGAVRALKRIRDIATTPSDPAKQLEEIETNAAAAIQSHLDAGARFHEIGAEIQAAMQCLNGESK